MMVGIALVNVGACAGVGPLDSPSIAGRYDLVAVNGAVLPCCGQIDSTGTRVTFVGGSLTLAEAPSESFAATRKISSLAYIPSGNDRERLHNNSFACRSSN